MKHLLNTHAEFLTKKYQEGTSQGVRAIQELAAGQEVGFASARAAQDEARSETTALITQAAEESTNFLDARLQAEATQTRAGTARSFGLLDQRAQERAGGTALREEQAAKTRGEELRSIVASSTADVSRQIEASDRAALQAAEARALTAAQQRAEGMAFAHILAGNQFVLEANQRALADGTLRLSQDVAGARGAIEGTASNVRGLITDVRSNRAHASRQIAGLPNEVTASIEARQRERQPQRLAIEASPTSSLAPSSGSRKRQRIQEPPGYTVQEPPSPVAIRETAPSPNLIDEVD
jgi:hypothetical protein